MDFADKMIDFYSSLNLKLKKSKDIDVLNPFTEKAVLRACTWYHKKYCQGDNKRIFLFGINPGRFGAGVTGIPFTDPIQMSELGFENDWKQRFELSAIYIDELINAYGSRKLFFQDFYISSVCPLGFVKYGKNINYYDETTLIEDTRKFIIRTIKDQISIGARTDVCFSLGKGKNYKYLVKLNQEKGFFDKVVALPHPRWVMQYKRKEKNKHVDQTLALLGNHK